MYRRSFLATLFILFFLQSFSNPKDSLRLENKNGNKFIVHRVTKAETLRSISKKYEVNESDILSSNPLLSERVFEGQVVKIPVNESKYGIVAVAPIKPLADSRLPLAKTLPNTGEKMAKKSEPIVKEEPIKAPLVVAVPESKQEVTLKPTSNKEEKPFKIYVVASPQTVQHLSESFAVDADEVIALNDLKNYNLKEGQKIKIPTDNTPIIAKSETKGSFKAAIKEDLPTLRTKPAEKIVAAAPAKEKKEVATANNKPIETKAKKVEQEETEYIEKLDTNNTFAMRKSKSEANFARLDSTYIHPSGIAYKAFDYKQTDYQFDLYSMRMAEANAIEVNNTNQNKGYGDKNTTHCVKLGETLVSIAKKYKISTTDIINWNGLTAYRVKVGQDLVVNSARGDLSPYERTVPNRAILNGETAIVYENMKGLARFDNVASHERGVYVNNIQKGKFVYIVNKDNYRKDFAIVMGPLPKGTPKDLIIIIDTETARELRIEKSWVNVELYYGTAVEEQVEKLLVPEAKK
jgi:LysM repeat protein